MTLSVVFLAYTSGSIVSTFVVTAGTFGAMSAYGLVTKRSLDGVGSFAFMGLIGVVLASVVNIFLRNDMLGFVLSCVGVIVFVRDSFERITVLHVGVADDYAFGGRYAGERVLQRLLQQIRQVARRTSGIRHVEVAYRQHRPRAATA